MSKVFTKHDAESGAIDLEDDALPEGSTVTILAADGDETFALDLADEARLLEVIDEATRGTAVDSSQVLGQIRPA